MNAPEFDWTQGAVAVVQQAKSSGDLVRLIMDGVSEVESWLVVNRIIPALRERNIKTLHFSVERGADKRAASLIPLADGSAFACNAQGAWFALARDEAAHEVEYIGSRYAPSDRWLAGFKATLDLPDGTETALTPTELARVWAEITGIRLSGFAVGFLDQIEAIGYDMADRVFHTQGRLGL